MRNILTTEQRTMLMRATARRMLAHDHVEEVTTPDTSGVLSVYIARGRPDKWRPWTKADHRRVPKPGVWVTPVPVDNTPMAFWEARRKIGLLESVDTEGGDCTCYFYPDPYTLDGDDLEGLYDSSTDTYAHDPSGADSPLQGSGLPYPDTPRSLPPLDTGTHHLKLEDIQLLNIHLGKVCAPSG